MQIFNKSGQLQFDLNVSKAFASGGEGSICEHPNNPNLAIKSYHIGRDLALESALLELNRLPNNFVKPVDIYYSKQGNSIVGFSMNYIDMNKYVILKKIFNNTFCLQHGYDKKVKYKIYQNIKSSVEAAHKLDIYVGDLNPYNILVNNVGDVIFLDVDSFGTKSKPHNGVLLEDIRDWLYHPRVDKSTDTYAFDILTFWMFTMMHPFRGDYPQHKTLEQRVVGKSSVLSNFPVTIPKCYHPFSNQTIIDQFKQVFHDGKRFLVDLAGQPQILQVSSINDPVIIDSADTFIRVLESDVVRVSVSDNFIAILKTDSVWYVYNLQNYGVYNKLYSIGGGEVYSGNKNVVYFKDGSLQQEGKILTNLFRPDITQQGSSLTIIDESFMVSDIDNIMNTTILSNIVPTYLKSLSFGDGGVWQTIGDKKWILDFNGSSFNLIKTPFNIKNIYKRKKYVLIEHVDKNKTHYTLCKIDGLNLVVGCDLNEWKYFDVKQDYVFIPEDGKISMINPVNQWKIVSEIQCSISRFDSRIYHTNAGMVVQTNDKVYLINKKQ